MESHVDICNYRPMEGFQNWKPSIVQRWGTYLGTYLPNLPKCTDRNGLIIIHSGGLISALLPSYLPGSNSQDTPDIMLFWHGYF